MRPRLPNPAIRGAIFVTLALAISIAGVSPAAALAGVPTASTDSVTALTASTAVVQGDINPGSQATTYMVDYDVAFSTWCTSNGGSGTPASSTTPAALGAVDGTDHGVSVNLSGLTGSVSYCAELVATNISGTADGGQLTFLAGQPSVTTSNATLTSATSAEVDGSVNPAGQATTYDVSYAISTSTWCSSGGASGSPTKGVGAKPPRQ